MVSGRKSSVSNLAPRKSSVALPSGLLKSYEVGDGPVERIDQIGKDTKVKLAELRELLEELAVNGLPKGAGGEGEAGRGVDDAVAQRQIRELKQKLKEREEQIVEMKSTMEMVEIGASKKDKALRNAQEQAAKVPDLEAKIRQLEAKVAAFEAERQQCITAASADAPAVPKADTKQKEAETKAKGSLFVEETERKQPEAAERKKAAAMDDLKDARPFVGLEISTHADTGADGKLIGLKVLEVRPGGPAAQAGIEAGQFIRNIYAGTDPPAQDTSINSNEAFEREILSRVPGDIVTFVLSTTNTHGDVVVSTLGVEIGGVGKTMHELRQLRAVVDASALEELRRERRLMDAKQRRQSLKMADSNPTKRKSTVGSASTLPPVKEPAPTAAAATAAAAAGASTPDPTTPRDNQPLVRTESPSLKKFTLTKPAAPKPPKPAGEPAAAPPAAAVAVAAPPVVAAATADPPPRKPSVSATSTGEARPLVPRPNLAAASAEAPAVRRPSLTAGGKPKASPFDSALAKPADGAFAVPTPVATASPSLTVQLSSPFGKSAGMPPGSPTPLRRQMSPGLKTFGAPSPKTKKPPMLGGELPPFDPNAY